eukprot:5524215-Alexandrium_andersonii.AAC.1
MCIRDSEETVLTHRFHRHANLNVTNPGQHVEDTLIGEQLRREGVFEVCPLHPALGRIEGHELGVRLALGEARGGSTTTPRS